MQIAIAFLAVNCTFTFCTFLKFLPCFINSICLSFVLLLIMLSAICLLMYSAFEQFWRFINAVIIIILLLLDREENKFDCFVKLV